MLFLCSGNYYRSRFAEGLFNHLAPARSLAWKARSGGLKIDPTGERNVGPLSPLTMQAFKKRAISFPVPLPHPRQVTLEDLQTSHLIVALKEAEHRALMRAGFPDWENRVQYWHVHDLDVAPPEQTLNDIDSRIRALLDELVASPTQNPGNPESATTSAKT